MGKIARVVALFLLLLGQACATSGPARSDWSSRPQPRAAQRNVLTYTEIVRSSAVDAFELVRHFRPLWLHKRGENHGDVVVFLNTARLGNSEALHGIPRQAITSIQFFDQAAARYQFGIDRGYAAILVRTDDRVPLTP